MTKPLKFDASMVTDQKRLVRGEQWLFARRLLRARDERHHGHWRVLILSGGAPTAEIKVIRELMRNTYILAVDTDPRCLEQAIDAGADDVLECDVLALDYRKGTLRQYANGSAGIFEGRGWFLPIPLQNRAKFDIIHLDLCGCVTPILQRALGLYLRQLVTPRGVLILTFSYGRDVAEMFMGLGREWDICKPNHREDVTTYQLPDEISETLAGRIMYLGQLRNVRSVMNYKGAEMPMCSVLYQAGTGVTPISYVKVGRGDYELAVVYPETANLYDCPQERIDTLRRKFAAIKASLTRERKVIPIQPSLLESESA